MILAGLVFGFFLLAVLANGALAIGAMFAHIDTPKDAEPSAKNRADHDAFFMTVL